MKRTTMKLSRLAPPKGAKKRRKLLGRGESSGLGKTSGRGGKGQTARSGGTIRAGFEGGQMPLYRRLPKKGFISRKRAAGLNRYAIIGLSDLERFDDGAEVGIELLQSSGLGGGADCRAGIKLLANGKLTKKLVVTVNKCSQAARKVIEELGGKVSTPAETQA